MRCIAGTKLIFTAPKRFAMAESDNRAIKILKAPPEITGFKYLMIWHPRLNTDAAHIWLRDVISKVGRSVAF
jgi:hypothetical protein